jgi:hypothetical protein
VKNAATTPLDWRQKEALRYILGKLAPDETILWQGVPDGETEARRGGRQSFLFYHVFVVLPLVVAFLVDGPPVTLVGALIANVCYLMVGGLLYAMFCSGSRTYRSYVVTSKRLLLNCYWSDTETLSELRYDSLHEIIVEDDKEAGTAGTRILGTLKFPGSKDRMQFDLVEDPYAVKEIIEAAKTAWSNR